VVGLTIPQLVSWGKRKTDGAPKPVYTIAIDKNLFPLRGSNHDSSALQAVAQSFNLLNKNTNLI
jgi:hypothetical protein